MITGLLSIFMVMCLLYGNIPLTPAMAISAGVGLVLIVGGHHSHGGVLTIDVLAHHSPLNRYDASFKAACCIILLVLSIASNSPTAPVFLLLTMMLFTVLGGGIEFHDYISMLSLPAVFLLLSGVALLWNYSPEALGVINVPFLNGFLMVTKETQASTALIITRAFGAVSCLYFLSLTTPMSELISVMRKARIPGIIVELSVLIYRYIFMLLNTYINMKNAAECRLGFVDYPTSVKTTGKIYGNLLGNSFRKADRCMDAMESRLYQGSLIFLEKKKPVGKLLGIMLPLIILIMLALVVLSYIM